MKRIKNVKELPVGTKIVNINGGEVDYYELLAVHPHNKDYVLLLDNLSQDAIKFYIPNIEDDAHWQIDYTDIDLLYYKFQYHVEIANRKLSRIREKQGESRTSGIVGFANATFGGGIRISIGGGEKRVALFLSELKKQTKVGEEIDTNDDAPSPQVVLEFDNLTSIEMMEDAFRCLSEYMKTGSFPAPDRFPRLKSVLRT